MKFYYRKQGPSGRGDKRVRYLVDAEENGSVRFFIGILEGFGDDWTVESYGDKRHYKSRVKAADGLAFEYQAKGSNWIFVLAIVKGLMEHKDGVAYFGSTMGYQAHVTHAVNRGLVIDETPEGEYRASECLKVAELGQRLYTELGLDKLPQNYGSRAYMWRWDKILGPDWISKLPG